LLSETSLLQTGLESKMKNITVKKNIMQVIVEKSHMHWVLGKRKKKEKSQKIVKIKLV
jgi:hypothetical protein